MPIPLGVLAVAGAGAAPGVPGVYQFLETVLVGSTPQSTITFSNLNSTYGSTYQHLQIRATLRTDRANNGDALRLRFNSDTGANYAYHTLRGEGSGSPFAEAAANQTVLEIAYSEAANNTANSFAAAIIDILDPFETTKNTTARGLSGFTSSIGRIPMYGGFWNNTAALTSIECRVAFGTNWVQGTRISLYGLRIANV